eukprot:s344_g4.t2
MENQCSFYTDISIFFNLTLLQKELPCHGNSAMRSSSKGQKVPRKSAAKASWVAQVPDLTINSRVLVKAVEGEDPFPGTVLFIGSTHFAEGTWLGVELDEAKGKNNGTVQNVHYFTARPAHGLFVRPAKVLRKQEALPLEQEKLRPPDSVPNFKVGAHVLVRPAQNSAGIVRFVGTTQFAEGEWVGIELEKPLGKNDGTVKGVAYFSCPAMHGIFARHHHVLEAPGSSTLPSSSSKLLTSPSSPSSTAPRVAEKKETGDTKLSVKVEIPRSAEVKEMKAEVERLRKELQRYQTLQESSRSLDAVPFRITKKMKEEFQNEIDQFLERRKPLIPRELSGPSGFGAFLQEQKKAIVSFHGTSFVDVAARASQLWRQLESDARNSFRERQRVATHRKSEKPKVAKDAKWKLESPGVSRHSDQYFCMVQEVRQTGTASIELDFLVQGDGSLGPLQKPEASKLMWDGKKRRCCPETPVRLKVNEDGGSSGPSRMEGTMVFKKALALPFASAIYQRRSALFVEDSDRESEERAESEDDSKLPAEQKAKALKAEEKETLSSLIKSYWDGKGSENQTAPVFKFDLDELPGIS